MNIDENWLNYADKKYPKTKATKQLDSHINKIQDVKAQLNAGKYRQRRQGNFIWTVICWTSYLFTDTKL